MTTSAAALPQGERDWWLRTLLVLQSPRPVFAALRDDSDEAAQARQEPLLAIILLAGVSLVLLVIGTRTVHGWTWPRAVAATALPAALLALALARAYGLV